MAPLLSSPSHSLIGRPPGLARGSETSNDTRLLTASPDQTGQPPLSPPFIGPQPGPVKT